MSVILDAGALISAEAGNPVVAALLRRSAARRIAVRTSAGVVTQVWRGGPRQAKVARVLDGVEVVPIGQNDAKRLGVLLARSGTADVVDAHVADLAHSGDLIVTSDAGHIRPLLRTVGVEAAIEAV